MMSFARRSVSPSAIQGFLLIALFLLSGSSLIAQVSREEAVSDWKAQNTEQAKPGSGREVRKEPRRGFADLITSTSYVFSSASAVALEDMSSGTTQLVAANLDDNASAVTNIGFEFFYDGVRFTQFSCNANGLCKLGSPAVTTSFDNGSATTGFATTTNSPKIAPYYDDLWIGTNGKVHMKVIGSAPNRKLVVEWQNMQIPRVAAGNTGAGTFQMWLFETSGVIEFVYGNGIVLNSANAGYTVGLQSGAATNFASVTTTALTVSYAAANNTQTNAITAGTAYIFTTQPAPIAPTTVTFTGTASTTTTVNWVDNSSTELGFAVYRSADGGTTYSFVGQVAAGVTSFNDSGLSPNTQYFYQVAAFTEGSVSTAATGSVTTTAAANLSCAGAGGAWSAPATWSGAAVPTAGDNVTVQTGCTVTIDTAASALSLTVGGTLQFEDTTARTLTVAGNVTVNAGGTLQSGVGGTVITHVLSVGGSLTNNGTLDFSTNSNTAGAGITFTGAANATFNGTGATTDIRSITVNKGTSSASVVDVSPTNFTVQGVNTDVAGFLTLTNGTFKISGTFTATNRVFTTAAYVIPTTAGIWLNNPNFTVAGTATSTTSGNNGLFRLTQGTYTIGLTAADGFDASATGAVYVIEGGTLNANGRFDPQGTVTYTQTGGTVNCAIVGNNRSSFGSFEIFGTGSTFNMSGGTINILQPSSGATKDDYSMTGTTQNITGGQIVFGATGAPTGSTYGMPFGTSFLPNFTVNTGMTLNVNNVVVFFRGTSITNNGTISSTGTSARFDFANPNAAMSLSGAGLFGTVVVPFASIGSNSPFQTTLTQPVVALRVNLFTSGFVNSGQITLGNGGASTTVVQIGSTGLTTPGGSFDASPVHNQGTGGEIVLYAFETAPRTTGFEINPTRSLTSISLVDNPSGVTIAGGNITLTSAAAALVLTNGEMKAGANKITLASGTATVTRTNGYVNGNFEKTFAAAGSKVFEVGANGFSPATANVTAGTFPATVTVTAIDGAIEGFDAAKSISRQWTVAAGAGTTADLSFTYLDADVNGNEADYRVYRKIGTGGPTTNLCPGAPCVTPATNVAGPAPGVTVFGRFTAAENGTPLAAGVSISGRVLSSEERGIRNAVVTISGGALTQPLTIRSGPNGRFTFDDIPAGETYVITVGARRFQFSNPSRIISVTDNIVGFDFMADDPR